MPFADLRRRATALALAAALAGCGTLDDLAPSGADERPEVPAGTVGPGVGQLAPDFTLPDVAGAEVSLYATLAGHRAAVVYFTMWCSICGEHMADQRDVLAPAFPDVAFLAVDYVSGSVAEAAQARVDAGFPGAPFTVLADVGAHEAAFYRSYMAVVVVDREHVVRWNGEYDGARIAALLAGLP